MTGKQKCRILREIRRQIAEKNDLRFVIEECTHRGKCRGTCPRCEWEVRMLESELEKRRASGRKVVLAGISAGFLLTSCSPIDTVKDLISDAGESLEGDMIAETASGAAAETGLSDETADTAETEVTVLEGEPALEEDIEEGEMEVVVTAGVPEAADTDEMPPLPGETEDPDECILIIEGDPIYPETDDGEMP